MTYKKQKLSIKMEKTINKLFAFGCWLLALLKIKAKGERLIANRLPFCSLSFCFLNFDILFTLTVIFWIKS